MPAVVRPTDNFTENNLFIGMPFFFFGPSLTAGGFGTYRDVGIVDAAELQKTVNLLELRRSQSGTSVLVRELVNSLDFRLQVQIFNWEAANMQYLVASSSLTPVSADPTATKTNDLVTTPPTLLEFIDLAEQDIADVALTQIAPATQTDEDIGTGDGTTGDASGDFTLDFPIKAVADVTSITVAGVAYTAVGVGAAAAGNEVEVVITLGGTNGDLQFFVGGVATNVTGAIVGTYTPSFIFSDFVLNTNYILDPIPGRVRFIDYGNQLIAGQQVNLGYTYDQKAHNQVVPGTQSIFAGRGRIQQLTDFGINILWDIPKVSIRLTDDPVSFSRDEPALATLIVALLDDGSATPYGTIKVFSEVEAAA